MKKPKIPPSEILTVKQGDITSRKNRKLSVLNLETGESLNIYPEHATIYDIPVEAVPSEIFLSVIFRDTVILDIRKRLKNVKELIKYCNPNTLNNICQLVGLVDIQSKYLDVYQPSAFKLLDKDIKELQKDFIYNCKAVPIENIAREVETDIKDTFYAIYTIKDLSGQAGQAFSYTDMLETFSFYLSGIIKTKNNSQ